jgi:hypothetical protein
MNEGYRWKKKLFSEQGRALLEKLSLAPWASRRRQAGHRTSLAFNQEVPGRRRRGAL